MLNVSIGEVYPTVDGDSVDVKPVFNCATSELDAPADLGSLETEGPLERGFPRRETGNRVVLGPEMGVLNRDVVFEGRPRQIEMDDRALDQIDRVANDGPHERETTIERTVSKPETREIVGVDNEQREIEIEVFDHDTVVLPTPVV